jgi:DNA modification methylase
MADQKAGLAILDPPYNYRVADVVGRGRTKHTEFAMASGEMSDEEFVAFLDQALNAAAAVSRDGAVHYVFMDWRGIDKLNAVGRLIYGLLLNVIVWVKTNGGQGSFYRSQYELISVFRVGKGQHRNNIQLGKYGRSRTNVWKYAGSNSFRTGRMEDLRAHPTVKPIALVSDIIRDCTRRSDTVLDTFCGSGTTILACERLGRHAVGIEIEPQYVDVAIRRWQDYSGRDAIHTGTGHTFDQMTRRRLRSRVRIAS